jgi:hypothetical protein
VSGGSNCPAEEVEIRSRPGQIVLTAQEIKSGLLECLGDLIEWKRRNMA